MKIGSCLTQEWASTPALPGIKVNVLPIASVRDKMNRSRFTGSTMTLAETVFTRQTRPSPCFHRSSRRQHPPCPFRRVGPRLHEGPKCSSAGALGKVAAQTDDLARRTAGFRRLLLIDFRNDDPLNQHRTELYPFLQAIARSRGSAAQWVSVAAGKQDRPHHPFQVDLASSKRSLLLEYISGFDPTSIIFNECVTPHLKQDISSVAPSVRIFDLGTRLSRSDWLSLFDMGTSPWHIPYDQSVQPDYDIEQLIPGPPDIRHFVPVIAPPYCAYNKSPARNPFFSDIDVSTVEHTLGCTFCVHEHIPELESPPPASCIDALLRQITSYDSTIPDDARSNRFMLLSGYLFSYFDKFLERFAALNLRESHLYLTCRIDEFLAAADTLRQWLPVLSKQGHSLHFWQMGLENFSPDENLRFNKGITPDQIEAAALQIDDLETRWPSSFFFRIHGGFGTIIFTPWTRLEDLRRNVDGARRFAPECMLTSRLQLREGTPLHLLAEKDGLIYDESSLESVPAWTTCLISFEESESFWRFQDQDVELVYLLLMLLMPRDDASEQASIIEEKRKELLPSSCWPKTIGDQKLEHFDAVLTAAEAHTTGMTLRSLFHGYLRECRSRRLDSCAQEEKNSPNGEFSLLFLAFCVEEASEASFFVFEHKNERRFYRKAGNLALSHKGTSISTLQAQFAGILADAMKQLCDMPLSREAIPKWEKAVTEKIRTSNLCNKIEWRLEEYRMF